MKVALFAVACIGLTQAIFLEDSQVNDIFAQADTDIDADSEAFQGKVSPDQTHIAVKTAADMSATIDMPMQETKRITVNKENLVVEDKDYDDGRAAAAAPRPKGRGPAGP